MTAMPSESVCEYLEWDSQFFGRRIARVKVTRLTNADMVNIRAWCHDHRIDCLYFLADSADSQTLKCAGRDNYQLVDIRVTLDCPPTRGPAASDSPCRVRTATERDIPGLRNIARMSYRDSRFYYDGNFAVSLCDSLYQVWIDKSCQGWAEKVLVAEEGGKPLGYVSCHLTGSRTGKIGLLGISEKARGRGLGRKLVHEALGWFANQQVESVSVVTQGRNVQAQRLYQRCGFVTRSVELWFHKWFPEKL
jgi:ribosomal protein S18 acetylase RimI-like enzyme